jgi:hypothetical protein
MKRKNSFGVTSIIITIISVLIGLVVGLYFLITTLSSKTTVTTPAPNRIVLSTAPPLNLGKSLFTNILKESFGKGEDYTSGPREGEDYKPAPRIPVVTANTTKEDIDKHLSDDMINNFDMFSNAGITADLDSNIKNYFRYVFFPMLDNALTSAPIETIEKISNVSDATSFNNVINGLSNDHYLFLLDYILKFNYLSGEYLTKMYNRSSVDQQKNMYAVFSGFLNIDVANVRNKLNNGWDQVDIPSATITSNTRLMSIPVFQLKSSKFKSVVLVFTGSDDGNAIPATLKVNNNSCNIANKYLRTTGVANIFVVPFVYPVTLSGDVVIDVTVAPGATASISKAMIIFVYY